VRRKDRAPSSAFLWANVEQFHNSTIAKKFLYACPEPVLA
jgi:hypothetical protein